MTVRYPIGVETFEKIIDEGLAYVDKTEVIYKLTQSSQFVFLSRPRRFGKSLTLSTIESYFEGRKDLFEGLWLGSAEGVDWTPRAVLLLNFISAKATVHHLNALISRHLEEWERIYDIQNKAESLEQRFFIAIKTAFQKSGHRVVILIDEYDKVLINTLHDPEMHELMKITLKPIYSVLKNADAYIKFAMLTGVSRFSKLSIFSDLNNLQDISMDDRFCTICGFTEPELRRYFAPGIEAFARKKNTDVEGMMQILTDNYDGYHFSKNCPDIYNPFSLLNALDVQDILHRWFESGTPTFLLKQIRETDEDVRDVLSQEVSAATLTNSSITDTGLLSILYQTGYLTIKHYDPEEETFMLGIPNREVEFGLYTGLLPLYTGRDEYANDSALIKMRRAIRAGEPDKFLLVLKSYLAAVPYCLSNGKPELYYENNLYLIFRMIGFDAQVETQTSQGRIDITMKTPKFIYIIELKLDGSPQEALRQIEDRNYALPYAADPRQTITIGIGFSSQTRTIDHWLIKAS